MAQKTNKATKAIKEIDKYIKACKKYGIENPYNAGAIWGMRKAQEIIKKRNI